MTSFSYAIYVALLDVLAEEDRSKPIEENVCPRR
jgi:hypothetical protein